MSASLRRVASIALPVLAAGALTRALHPQLSAPDDSSTALASALAEARARVSTLEARVAELESTLAAERAERARTEGALRLEVRLLQEELMNAAEARFAREEEWLGFTRTLAMMASGSLAPDQLAELLRGPVSLEDGEARATEASADEGPAALVAPPDGRSARDDEVQRRLRALFVVEDVRGYEVLEAGNVADGATGPVVLRVSDERGRPVGSLSAERLRLEASRSGRALAIVLEDGYERRGGMRYAFEGDDGGVRRISLPHVDPRPWIEALPQLFRFDDTGPVVDDGRFNLTLVQRAMNVMFDEDIASGHYRLAALGGVLGAGLRDVQLDQLDEQGHVLRTLIADRMTIETRSRGVMLLLEDGVQVRGGRKVAFLDGRYRIFLPQVDESVWIELGLPGLAEPATSPLAHDSGLPLPRRLVK